MSFQENHQSSSWKQDFDLYKGIPRSSPFIVVLQGIGYDKPKESRKMMINFDWQSESKFQEFS